MRWGGRRAQAWTTAVLARKGRLCLLQYPGCTRVATTADHIIPLSLRPDLAYDVTNGQPACLHCNSSKGARVDVHPVVDRLGVLVVDRLGVLLRARLPAEANAQLLGFNEEKGVAAETDPTRLTAPTSSVSPSPPPSPVPGSGSTPTYPTS